MGTGFFEAVVRIGVWVLIMVLVDRVVRRLRHEDDERSRHENDDAELLSGVGYGAGANVFVLGLFLCGLIAVVMFAGYFLRHLLLG